MGMRLGMRPGMRPGDPHGNESGNETRWPTWEWDCKTWEWPRVTWEWDQLSHIGMMTSNHRFQHNLSSTRCCLWGTVYMVRNGDKSNFCTVFKFHSTWYIVWESNPILQASVKCTRAYHMWSTVLLRSHGSVSQGPSTRVKISNLSLHCLSMCDAPLYSKEGDKDHVWQFHTLFLLLVLYLFFTI